MMFNKKYSISLLLFALTSNQSFAWEKLGLKPLGFTNIQYELNNYNNNPTNPGNVANARINGLMNRIRKLEEELEDRNTKQYISTGDPIIDYHANEIRYYEELARKTHNKNYAKIFEHEEALQEYLNSLKEQRNINIERQKQQEYQTKEQQKINTEKQKQQQYQSNDIYSQPNHFVNKSSTTRVQNLSKSDIVYNKCIPSVVILNINTNLGDIFISGFYLGNDNYLYTSLEPIIKIYKINYITAKTIKGKDLKIKGIIGHSENLDIVLFETENNDSYLSSANCNYNEEIVTVGDIKYCKYSISTGNILQSNPNSIYFSANSEFTNIGGPLLSMEGEAIGIITKSKTGNYALPISLVQNLIKYKEPVEISFVLANKNKKITNINNALITKDQSQDKQGDKLKEIISAFKNREIEKCYNLGINSNNMFEENPIFNQIMSVCAFNKANYNEAINYSEKAITLYNNEKDTSLHSKFYLTIGCSCLKLKNFEKSISSFEESLKYKPTNEDLFLIYCYLGDAYFELQKYYKSQYYYTKSLNHSTDDDLSKTIKDRIETIKKNRK